MFEIGTATDHIDLADKLNTFLTATGSAFALQYAGVGTGTLTAYKGGASSVAETFVITATSSTSFTVVGSASGSIGPATVGTPFAHAKIAFLLTAGGVAFSIGDAFTLSTAPKWTSLCSPVTASSTKWRLRVITTGAGSNCEVGELEMMTTPGGSTVTAGGTALASTGSSAANAFDGNNTTRCQLTGTAGWIEYDFASPQAIKEFAVTLSSATIAGTSAMPRDFTLEYWDGTSWVIAGSYRNETAWAVGERRAFRCYTRIWQAPGNDGLSQILVGIHPFQNAATGWYNWRLNGLTAYDASQDFFSQPGVIKTTPPYGPVLPLTNSSIGYWFACNGRHVRLVVKCGAVYGAAYLGLPNTYSSPGQWPYPLFIGGSLYFADSVGEPASNSSLWLVGSSNANHTTFVLPFVDLSSLTVQADLPLSGPGRLRKASGAWLGFFSRSSFYDTQQVSPAGAVWPWSHGFTNLKPGLDGGYDLFPAVLLERGPTNMYGQLEGIAAVTGSGIAAESTIDVPLAAGLATPARRWVAFPDVGRSTAGDFFAMALD